MNAKQPLFILDRGTTSGPYTVEQIETLVAQGQCNLFSKVSSDKASWVSVESFLTSVNHERSRAKPIIPPPPPGGVAAAAFAESHGQQIVRIREVEIVRSFPVFALLLLHFFTCGIFTFFWITGLHGKLPKTRADDFSGAKAIALSLMPFYNLFWFFIVYPRLCSRVAAVSRQYNLKPVALLPLCYAMCVCIVVPVAMAIAGLTVFMIMLFSTTSKSEVVTLFFVIPNVLTLVNLLLIVPWFAANVQRAVNLISDAQISELRYAAVR